MNEPSTGKWNIKEQEQLISAVNKVATQLTELVKLLRERLPASATPNK